MNNIDFYRCDLRCPSGHHGDECQSECKCQNGGECDTQTGQCLCSSGWSVCIQFFKINLLKFCFFTKWPR